MDDLTKIDIIAALYLLGIIGFCIFVNYALFKLAGYL